VRAGLAALATGVVFGAAFASEYVDVHLISLVAPALVGLGCGAAASLANRGQADRLIVVMSLLPALLGTALGFRLQPGGGQSVVSPAWEVGPPYLAAVLGTAAWPLLFGPPRRPRRRTRNQRDGDGDGVGEVT
jgi:hypothetical protein